MNNQRQTSNGVKRVLIFSLAYFPKFVGGAEIAVKEITDRTPDIEFHMVCARLDRASLKEEKIGNVLVHRIGFGNAGIVNKFLFQFLAARKALSLHRKYSYDCVWAIMAHSSGVPAALFKLFYPRVPYVLTLQEGDPPTTIERKMWLVWPFFSRAFISADVVQAISTFLGKWARRRKFKGPLEVIPNGVDVAHFSQTYTERTVDEIKDELGKRMGDVFLVTTSRLVHKNAIDDVIIALAVLPENVKFIIIGTGPLETDLKLKTKNLKLESRVRFIGHIGHAELPKYLKASDIFIRPSRSEGMGNSFVEAMAAGLPVIATQEGGIADFLFDPVRNHARALARPEGAYGRAISNGVDEKRSFAHDAWTSAPIEFQTGWAVDTDSPKQIAAQVKNIMEHPEKVRAVVATAKAMVMEKYDWDLIAKDMREKVFKPLLARG